MTKEYLKGRTFAMELIAEPGHVSSLVKECVQ